VRDDEDADDGVDDGRGTRMSSRNTGGAGGADAEPIDVHDPDGVRLQKVLASAGLGSRRACEVMIAEGRISVDGTLVTEVGVRIDPTSAQVQVDGLPLQLDTSRIYLALNKPRGVVSTMDDPEGRPSLAQFVEHRRDRLFHVGRLDADTEGLILLTNDGDMAHRLQHPSYEVPKTYLAEVLVSGGHGGGVPQGIGARMRAGIELEDGVVTADSFRLIDSQPGRALVEVIVHEGRKHVVRRMLTEVGLPVQRLVRVQLGPVHLGDLRPGAKRALNREEIGLLRGRGAGSRTKETKRGNGGRERAARPVSDR
jgi:23S rRNA pseudouridine2605 synthase